MHKYVAAFAVPLCAVISGSAAMAADGAAISVPLNGRVLGFTLPATMELVTDKDNGTNLLNEYVPSAETLADWTRLVTIQAYRGLSGGPVPTAEIARQAFYPAACKLGPLYADGGEVDIGGGLKRALISSGCATLPVGAYPKALAGAGEQDFILIFRDQETIYTLNYAVRGKSFMGKAPPIALDDAEAVVTQIFGTVRLDPTKR